MAIRLQGDDGGNRLSGRHEWWTEDTIPVHQRVWSTVKDLHDEQKPRQDRNLRCIRLYGNRNFYGLTPYSYERKKASTLPEDRVKINIISSMCDTVTAKLAKMKPRIAFLSSGGNFDIKLRAKKLQKYILGMFIENDVYSTGQQAFKDSTVTDVGIVKTYIKNNKIVTERVMANELYVDDREALYGDPRTIYQVKYVPKSVLAARYPKFKHLIATCSSSFDEATDFNDKASNLAVVIEGWHLKSGPSAKDGKHVIIIDNAELFSEDYKKDWFPFTFLRWANPMVGFWGQSLADRLVGNQLEINTMLSTIQRSFRLGSSFKVFLEYGSRVVPDHLNNDIGAIVYYAGTKPEYSVPQTVHPEYFQHLRWLIENSYQEAGVSQLSASAKKPYGLDAAVAMREYEDIESERFILSGQAYEKFFLELAYVYIELAKELYSRGVDVEIKAPARNFLESIKWSDIDLEADQYHMQMFPVSMLPHKPEGRLAMVQDLMTLGFLDRDTAISLLDFPDLESEFSLGLSARHIMEKTIADILEGREYLQPEPYENLQLGIKMMQDAYLRARTESVPEDRLDSMRQWITRAKSLQDKAVVEAQRKAAELAGAQPQMAEQQPQLAAAPEQ